MCSPAAASAYRVLARNVGYAIRVARRELPRDDRVLACLKCGLREVDAALRPKGDRSACEQLSLGPAHVDPLARLLGALATRADSSGAGSYGCEPTASLRATLPPAGGEGLGAAASKTDTDLWRETGKARGPRSSAGSYGCEPTASPRAPHPPAGSEGGVAAAQAVESSGPCGKRTLWLYYLLPPADVEPTDGRTAQGAEPEGRDVAVQTVEEEAVVEEQVVEEG